MLERCFIATPVELGKPWKKYLVPFKMQKWKSELLGKEKGTRYSWLEKQLKTPPAKGKINFLITHREVLEGIGIPDSTAEWFGAAAIFDPSADLLGCVLPADWKKLVN